MDHTPGDRLTDFTVRNLGFSDASELFVFISAYSAGMVYSSRAARDGLWAVAHRVWRRAAQIYLAHIVLLVTAALLAAQLTRVMGDPQFVQGMNIGPLLEQPGPTFLQALALLFQPTFMNILPLYIVMLAAFPLILWLIRRNAGMALGVSVLAHEAVHLRGVIDEAKTECESVRWAAGVARALGATPQAAAFIADWKFSVGADHLPEQYQTTTDCRIAPAG